MPADLGICDFGQNYLREVQIATESMPGVASLSYENIERSLSQLPDGARAIVYMHWGVEHSSVQAPKNLNIARKFLNDSRVAIIVGMHPHVIQGRILQKNKYCYMSLGHFYWPDFLITPPNISVDGIPPLKTTRTKGYHNVCKLTHKVWMNVNRTGLLIAFDTKRDKV